MVLVTHNDIDIDSNSNESMIMMDEFGLRQETQLLSSIVTTRDQVRTRSGADSLNTTKKNTPKLNENIATPLLEGVMNIGNAFVQ